MTSQALIDDVQLIASNAEVFNGEASAEAKLGKKLIEKIRQALSRDREIFGVEGDAFRIIEEMIAKK